MTLAVKQDEAFNTPHIGVLGPDAVVQSKVPVCQTSCWTVVPASAEHVISGTGALVKVANTAVALFNVNGQIFAIDDVCIRCGSSLAAGELHATLLCCSGCGWQYDVTTGSVKGVAALRIQTFEAKVADAAILVATTARQTF